MRIPWGLFWSGLFVVLSAMAGAVFCVLVIWTVFSFLPNIGLETDITRYVVMHWVPALIAPLSFILLGTRLAPGGKSAPRGRIAVALAVVWGCLGGLEVLLGNQGYVFTPRGGWEGIIPAFLSLMGASLALWFVKRSTCEVPRSK